MSTIQISRKVFTDVESALRAGFNDALSVACSDFGIDKQAFQIDFDVTGKNYFRAPFTLDDIRSKKSDGTQWPCLTLSTGAVVDEHLQFPTTFDGPVAIHIGVYHRFTDPFAADLETITQATESTIVTILASVYGLREGTLQIEKDTPEFLNDCWYVGQHIAAEFQLTA